MKKVKVIVARPGEDAFVMEIIPDYKHLAALVGGHIEQTFPISDDVAVICDECGKLKGKLPNRLIFGTMSQKFIDEGKNVDAFAGTIVIIGCRAEKEEYDSLTEAEIDLFMELYEKPQFKCNWNLGGDEYAD